MNGYQKELISPSGEKYVSTSPIETNNLVYGSGYREVDEASAEQADSPEDVRRRDNDDAEASPRYDNSGELPAADADEVGP